MQSNPVIRVDLRLFTTAPFLYETYQEKIFCRKYEELRNFETVYSQDLLLRYSSYDDMQLVKLYQEGGAEARLKIRGVRRIFFYCNRDGLFSIDPVKGIV